MLNTNKPSPACRWAVDALHAGSPAVSSSMSGSPCGRVPSQRVACWGPLSLLGRLSRPVCACWALLPATTGWVPPGLPECCLRRAITAAAPLLTPCCACMEASRSHAYRCPLACRLWSSQSSLLRSVSLCCSASVVIRFPHFHATSGCAAELAESCRRGPGAARQKPCVHATRPHWPT